MIQTLDTPPETHIQEILNQLNTKYMVPEYYIVNKWSFSNDQVNVAYLYTRNGITLNLKALYQACVSYLKKNEISPTKKVKVGGNLHRYDPPKKILSLKKLKYNPNFIAGPNKNIYYEMLTLRVKWRGFTICFWTRGVRLHTYTNFTVTKHALDFIQELICKTLDYPSHLIRFHLKNNSLTRLKWIVNSNRDRIENRFNFVI